MLTLALATTLVGFGLLVVALITNNFWLAVACIAVCVIGLGILLWDTLRSARAGSDDDEPLFTIRDREDEPRSAPLIDEAPTGAAPTGVLPEAAVAGVEFQGLAPGDPETGEPATGEPETGAPATGEPDVGEFVPTAPFEAVDGGLGDLVVTGGPDDAVPSPGAVPAGEVTSGDANDYIRSVTGSFPAQENWPVASMPYAESSPIAQSFARGPDTGPIQAASPYVGRRRRRAGDDPGPFTGQQPVVRVDEPAEQQPPEVPSGEAPVAAAPAFEGPGFEAPAFEAPAFEAPVFEAPVFEAPAPSAPPGWPAPAGPVTAGPIGAEAVPTVPVPSAPVPTAPVPTAPTAPIEPVPTATAPTAPAPTEPVPTEPAPTEPIAVAAPGPAPTAQRPPSPLIVAPAPSTAISDVDPIGDVGGVIVVHDHTGPLPKISYVDGDE